MADEARLIVRFEGVGGIGSSGGGLPAPSPAPGSGQGGGGSPGGGISYQPPSPAPPKDKGGDSKDKTASDTIRDILKQANINPTASGEMAIGALSRAEAALAANSAAGMAIPAIGAAIGVAAAGGLIANRVFESTLAGSGQYSGMVATSQAEADVRRINRQLSQAKIFEDEQAAIIRARSKAEEASARFWEPHQEKILQALQGFEELKTGVFQWATENRLVLDSLLVALAGASGIPAIIDALASIRKQGEEAKQNSNGNRFPVLDHLPLPAGYEEGDLGPLNVNFNGPVLDQDIFN